MDGIAFYIGTLGITWYGILVILGTVSAFTFIYYRWKKNNFSKYHFWLLSTFTLLFALFGARWWYLMFNPSAWTGVEDLFRIGAGRSIQGAVFFGTAFMLIYTTWIAPSLNFRKVASTIFPHILLAQAIGRWGNFFNQEVYGLEVAVEQLQWLPQFVIDGMYIDGAYRQPLFLYESMANLVGWLLIAFVLYNIKWFKPGTMVSMYAIWYNTTRLSMELYRDPEFIMNINGVPTTFIMTAIFLIYGIVSFVVYQWYFDDIAAWQKYFMSARIRLIKSQTILTIQRIMMKHGKQQYKTLMSVVRNKYDKYVESLDYDEIASYKKEQMIWEK